VTLAEVFKRTTWREVATYLRAHAPDSYQLARLEPVFVQISAVQGSEPAAITLLLCESSNPHWPDVVTADGSTWGQHWPDRKLPDKVADQPFQYDPSLLPWSAWLSLRVNPPPSDLADAALCAICLNAMTRFGLSLEEVNLALRRIVRRPGLMR
jgi:hypothetical protein